MKESLVIGGSNGIGLAIAMALAEKGHLVHVVDKAQNNLQEAHGSIRFQQVNLLNTDFSFLESYKAIYLKKQD